MHGRPVCDEDFVGSVGQRILIRLEDKRERETHLSDLMGRNTVKVRMNG